MREEYLTIGLIAALLLLTFVIMATREIREKRKFSKKISMGDL